VADREPRVTTSLTADRCGPIVLNDNGNAPAALATDIAFRSGAGHEEEPLMSVGHVNAGPRQDTRGSRKRVAPGVFERAGKYLISYVDTTGREHVETIGPVKTLTNKHGLTLRQAIAAREKKRVELRSGDAVSPTRMTVAEAWADYSASLDARVGTGELAPRTRDLYAQRWKTHLEPRIGRLPIQSVRAEHVARVLRELRQAGLSSWTTQGVLIVVGALFGHAVVRGWVAQTPVLRLAKGERPRPRNKRRVKLLTPEELARVIKKTTARWRPLFIAASLTGARISELLGLTWADLDLEAGTIKIELQLGRDGRRTRCKTTRSVRTLAMGAELRRNLLEHFMASRDKRPGAFVFACEGGAPPSYHNARKALAKAIDKAGITYDNERERLSFHAFRHAAVSAMIRAGIDPVRIAAFVGDRVETILSTYAHEWATLKDDNLGDVLGDAMGNSS
jgi:integrase